MLTILPWSTVQGNDGIIDDATGKVMGDKFFSEDDGDADW